MATNYNHTYYAQGRSNSDAGPTQYPRTSSSKSFDTYTDFVLYISQRKCASCNTAFISSSRQVESLFQDWLSNEAPINSRVTCLTCSIITCIACVDKESHKTADHDVQGAKISWCCSRGRLFIIWIILCGFDIMYCRAKARDHATTNTIRKPQRPPPMDYPGYNYGRTPRFTNKPNDGTGYDDWFGVRLGKGAHGHLEQDLSQEKARAGDKEKRGDQFHMLVFAFLKTLMPSAEGGSNFDAAPPGALASMLANSKVLDKAAELLRNDSLADVTKRKHLYTTLLDFLRALGTHDATKATAICDDRIVWPDNVNLLTLSFQGPGANRSEASSSLAAGLRNLNIQSELMLKCAMTSATAKNDFADQQGADLLSLCRMISDLSTHLRIGNNVNQQRLTTHGVVEVPDDQIWPTYYFTRQAQAAMQAPRGRIKRLITEITTLKTGLAEGIFIKHAMSRLDVMKVLIVGPQGTPYEDGLFEFDLFCPYTFPQESPAVHFKGANGISVNPTLHRDGKVCLSLLGTWPGQKWTTESTILQVLISIQAMIFNEHPISNEPGNASLTNTDESRRCNVGIRALTAKFAILNWATNPPALWREEVQSHFNQNADRIRRNLEQWARDPQEGLPPMRRGHPVEITWELPKIQQALRSYGATYIPESFTPTSNQQNPYSRGFGSQYGRGGMYGGPRGGKGFSGHGSTYGRGF